MKRNVGLSHDHNARTGCPNFSAIEVLNFCFPICIFRIPLVEPPWPRRPNERLRTPAKAVHLKRSSWLQNQRRNVNPRLPKHPSKPHLDRTTRWTFLAVVERPSHLQRSKLFALRRNVKRTRRFSRYDTCRILIQLLSYLWTGSQGVESQVQETKVSTREARCKWEQ